MREPLRISNSVTASAPLFDTSKVVGPEASLSGAGEQPSSVSATFTCFEPDAPEPDPPLEPELPHPATIRPATSSAVPPATRARPGRRLPRHGRQLSGQATYRQTGTA